MSTGGDASIHASAVLVGDRGILIRGPSGSGKSRLAFDLILAGGAGQIPAVTLIGDDRVRLTVANGRLVVQGVPELAGMIEIRGLGIRTISHAAEASVAVVIDLDAADAERLPPPQTLKTQVSGLEIPRIPVGRGYAALPLVLAFLTTV
ncbi:serine kinase of HPr protein (carbohydrate metabolism regulator) [Afipia massiliensis]|uniref:Serine kinase of HPr protein (Carbohydrate metabolism regulator) n=1 Tax=Afipia massiliensis TaxID=211460 RepID=A0A840N5S1_9BRAD|nr:HPr kinase/phosphatase C-terminal domain-containing protein [Afipia massiliensis]MBB5053121.1 serine kinase of HPr protein (carbohydrate metabolism regulator) [Afipia massiliensis]